MLVISSLVNPWSSLILFVKCILVLLHHHMNKLGLGCACYKDYVYIGKRRKCSQHIFLEGLVFYHIT